MDTRLDPQPESPQASRQHSLNARLIAEQITKLLSHYWSTGEDQALRKAQAADWLEDLSQFTAAAVESACREWRRMHSKRPLIADIRALCVEYRPVSRALPAPERPAGRPSDGVIRDDFRTRAVRDWSRAELDTSWNETEAKMVAEGFEQRADEDSLSWHARYARSKMNAKSISA